VSSPSSIICSGLTISLLEEYLLLWSIRCRLLSALVLTLLADIAIFLWCIKYKTARQKRRQGALPVLFDFGSDREEDARAASLKTMAMGNLNIYFFDY
jgi:hypothetical protein